MAATLHCAVLCAVPYTHVMIWLTVCIADCGPSRRSVYSCATSSRPDNSEPFASRPRVTFTGQALSSSYVITAASSQHGKAA